MIFLPFYQAGKSICREIMDVVIQRITVKILTLKRIIYRQRRQCFIICSGGLLPEAFYGVPGIIMNSNGSLSDLLIYNPFDGT